ncbi:MAG TPA: gliding motility protein GldL [Sphingobacteriaceae bacterium]|nr:gliding motility protein GldL [Sphingobacteriaceae bacterium]
MAKKKKIKIGINSLISWGASIVIIGLMFKILHWKNGETMIAFGLVTEACLFFILGFQAESTDPDWTRLYPELDENFEGELPLTSIQPSGASASLDKMMSEAKIGPELIASLGTGLRSFGEKVSSISTMADASVATNEFTGKLKAASDSYDRMSSAFNKASENLAEMANSNVDSKAYHEQINNMAKNLSALNAVYELELQDSSSHLKAMNKFYQNLSLTMQNFNESMEDSKSFKEEVGKLAKNLSSLNAIYGNMLSAMNQSRT